MADEDKTTTPTPEQSNLMKAGVLLLALAVGLLGACVYKLYLAPTSLKELVIGGDSHYKIVLKADDSGAKISLENSESDAEKVVISTFRKGENNHRAGMKISSGDATYLEFSSSSTDDKSHLYYVDENGEKVDLADLSKWLKHKTGDAPLGTEGK